tara:strand:+ start:3168 stop:4529 length:1362 start_codon:yes stop_codon:yes gene_type:complete
MKIKVNSKKGLKTSLSIFVDKETIQKKLDEKLVQLKEKVRLKGFRPGKVPPSVIKSQFGKAIYGEVIDEILKETSKKAIEENKFKIAGQPKIELKTFGEGKDLDYRMEVETLPNIKLKGLENIKAIDYEILVEDSTVKKRLNEIAKSQQSFSDKKEGEKAEKGDLVIFNYTATVEGKDFEGNKGKDIQIIIGKDLFIKGFDGQLIGVKKNMDKSVTVKLPENYPKKELANKKSKFDCKIINVKKPEEIKIDNDLAKKLGAKDLEDLKSLIKKQIVSEHKRSLETITKKNILDQIERSHNVDLPANLVEQETKIITQNLKKEDIEKYKDKNVKLAKSRIKIGLILNEIGEKNKLKINEQEVKNEIQKHIKNMPGQEKIVMEYYQKNPSAIASLRGVLYEDKIIQLIKTKISLSKKNITLKESEEIIKNFSEKTEKSRKTDFKKNQQKSKNKKKK